MTTDRLAVLVLINVVLTCAGVALVLRALLAIGEALVELDAKTDPKRRLERARALWRALPGAPEAKPTGGAQRLGKITSNVSVPTHEEGGSDGK